MEQDDVIRSEDGKSTRYCVSFTEMVSPSNNEINLTGYSSEQVGKFYSLFINAMHGIINEHGGGELQGIWRQYQVIFS